MSHEGKSCTKFLNPYNFICSKFCKLYKYNINISHKKTTGLRNNFNNEHVNKTLLWPHDVGSFQGSTFCLLWCSSRYGTAVEHRSLLNRSGICDGIICCNIFFVHTVVLSIKTAFNIVKIHLFRIMLLIQWSVFFFVVHVTVFGRLKYILRLFSEYMLTFMVEEPMKMCVAS